MNVIDDLTGAQCRQCPAARGQGDEAAQGFHIAEPGRQPVDQGLQAALIGLAESLVEVDIERRQDMVHGRLAFTQGGIECLSRPICLDQLGIAQDSKL